MKTKNIKDYKPLVKFLRKSLGPNTEVVLHDLSDYDNSIIAIENGHISGRKVGGPVTNLVLEVVKKGSYKEENYITNYTGKSKEGKLLKSSSFFIEDYEDNIIGVLCINIDFSTFIKLDKELKKIINYDLKEEFIKPSNNYKTENKEIRENFVENIEDLTQTTIQSIISDIGVTPKRMSPEEKMEIVEKLYQKGIFLIKGEVSRVAEYLKVSEATVYRYLNKIKE